MGHKVNPVVFRTGILWGWKSNWFSHKNYAVWLKHDIEMRRMITKKFKEAGVAGIEIERTSRILKLTIHAAKPGVIIGRGGAASEELKKDLKKKFAGNCELQLNIIEVAQPGLTSAVVVQNMAADIEKRMPFRRVMKQVIDRVQKAGAQGVKVIISGRLDGAEIARRETLAWGKIPLQTLRANIDYSRSAAYTTYGAIGLKVWIYKGEVFDEKKPA
ncbi:30S ribosomal protein S3 [Candidatus Uhrbacteria bacterium]|nr:30S ribosomal protein S3 [Candidatus Uhrbacteria bacterium]